MDAINTLRAEVFIDKDGKEKIKFSKNGESVANPVETAAICPDSGRFALDSVLEGMPPAGRSAEDETKPQGRWEVTELKPRHREVMRRILEGATYVEIAEEMGLHPQTIMLIATSRLFKEELIKLEAEADRGVIQRAEAMSHEALDVIKLRMRTAKSQSLQVHCAERILDTAGYNKIEKKVVGIVSGEDVIKALNKQRRERILGGSGSPDSSEGSASGDSVGGIECSSFESSFTETTD